MGWMPEEFAAGGQQFGQRGKRADEMITVLRKLWSGDWVEHHGEFYDFAPLRMRPAPTAPIPVYVGGFLEARAAPRSAERRLDRGPPQPR